MPLALTSIANLLIVLTHRAGGDNGEVELVPRSEWLRSWMLPVMAKAVEEDEEEAKAFALLRSVQNLSKK